MKIGELSRRCEVSIRMLRYYEEEGLLKPQRSPSGFREYGPREEQTVERIKLLGSAGHDARHDQTVSAVHPG
ncbi:MerR family DNA-binding transcriptional regulator [Stutzerimonas stutzeri]|uniref:MerR family DNA-binding transcriptional regulator n=1 Tax=Stutzerimonas stutzeri TaxID=316 RepID=UPI0026CA24CC